MLSNRKMSTPGDFTGFKVKFGAVLTELLAKPILSTITAEEIAIFYETEHHLLILSSFTRFDQNGYNAVIWMILV